MESEKDDPEVAWSPNGRYLAMTSEGFSTKDYSFAVIDMPARRPLVHCESGQVCKWGQFFALVWTPDSRSFFTATQYWTRKGWQPSGGIDRIDLSGRRSNVVPQSPGWAFPRVALPTGLVYEKLTEKRDHQISRDALYRLDFSPGRHEPIFSSRSGIGMVLPLTHLP